MPLPRMPSSPESTRRGKKGENASVSFPYPTCFFIMG